MFVIAGSAQPQWEIKDFAKESGMNQYANKEDHKFIAVYPLPQKHLIGRYSNKAAWAWNAEGSLIHDKDLKFNGYDDMKYIKSIADMVPKLATVDSTHKDWGAIGWSQGAVFLNAIVSKQPNLFPSVGIVGGSMQTDYHYSKQPGNAENVAIVNLLGDKITLPSSGNFKYRKEEFLERVLGHIGRRDIIEKANPLAAIDNVHQDPKLMENFYKQNLFAKSTQPASHDLATPAHSSHKDYVREYKPNDPTSARSLTVFGLVDAKHSYPGPLHDNARTNAQEKYTEFDASGEFVKLFNRYNDQVHSKKSP
jgi:hypothetical protein